MFTRNDFVMKTLFLVRHAKSSWEDAGLSDKERPLKKRGASDAQIMGRVLHKHGIKPGQIVSSPAKRAFDTAEIIAAQLSFDKRKIENRKYTYDFHRVGRLNRDTKDQRVICRDGFKL